MRVVVLPGMDGSEAVRAAFLAELSRKVPTTFVPLPDTVVLDYPAAVALARLQLPVDEPYVLVAESFSGPTAVRIALQNPSGLRALVLCDTFLRSPRPLLLRLVTMLPPPRRKPPALVYRWALLGKWSTSARLEVLMEAIDRHPPEVVRSRLHAIASEDQRNVVARLQIPTLCLHGTHDRLVPRHVFRETGRCIAHAQLQLMPGPHALMLAQPQETAARIVAFMEEQGCLQGSGNTLPVEDERQE